MKKIFTTTMCMALVAMTLTACGGNTENTSKNDKDPEVTEISVETQSEIEETDKVDETKPEVEEQEEKETPEVEQEATEETAVTEVNTTEYEFHGSSTVFPVRDNDNEPYQRLVAAGIADDSIYAGSAIIFADDGTWILYMNGPEDSSIRLSFPGESEDITPEEEWNNLVDVFLSVLAEYKDGTRTAIDVNNDGVIDSTDNEICCYFSCGVPIYGSIWAE